jgi:hypothetical protein
MPVETENIKNNVDDIKNNTYGKKIYDKVSAYKTGAVLGIAGGVITGFVMRWNLLLCAVVGGVGVGYIGYRLAESSEPKVQFKNLSTVKVKKDVKVTEDKVVTDKV